MPRRIAFLAGVAGRDRLAAAWAAEVERRYDVEPIYLAEQPIAVETLVALGVGRDRIFAVEPGRWRETIPDLALLERTDAAFARLERGRNLWMCWAAVRRGSHPYEDALKILTWAVKTYARFLDEMRPETIVVDASASFNLLVLAQLAELRGVEFRVAYPSRLPDRFFVHRGIVEDLPDVRAAYRRYRAEGVPPASAAEAERFIAAFRAGGTAPSTIAAARDRLAAPLSRLANLARSVVAYRPGSFIRPRNPLGPFGYAATRLAAEARRASLPWRVRFDSPPDEGERYALFPLHNQPEATTMVKGPVFTDQVALVENVARSLPAGVRLYAKEHWIGVGNRPLGYYDSLRRHPNVAVLGPDVPNRPLIRRAALTFTVSGTTGWESLLYGVPSVVFGEVFYRDFDAGVFPCADLTALPALARRLVETFRPDETAIRAYVAAHTDGTYAGFPMAPMACRDASLAPENVARIAEGLGRALDLAPRAR